MSVDFTTTRYLRYQFIIFEQYDSGTRVGGVGGRWGKKERKKTLAQREHGGHIGMCSAELHPLRWKSISADSAACH